MTEPKLLIKILHVTFTGGPVKWNDNDTMRRNQREKSRRRILLKNEFGVGEMLRLKVKVCCLMPTCNNSDEQRLFVLCVRSQELQAKVVARYMLC